MSEQLIVVDWGTSNFRAYLIDRHSGAIVDERATPHGMRSLQSAQFPDYCADALKGWRSEAQPVPVYMAGMVGAKRGWAESPQLSLPVGLNELCHQMIAAPNFTSGWILPGVKIIDTGEAELVDVMRGEEIQLFGALALADNPAELHCCLPGTHSKWARIRNGQLERFTTAMTGELYQAVMEHTLPGEPAQPDAPFDDNAFQLGMRRVAADGGVLHALFEARSRYLYAGLGPEAISSFISGVLIGEEVQRMAACWETPAHLHLIGSHTLMAPYTTALAQCGIEVTHISARDATLAGVRALAQNHLSEQGPH
ncbi:2-dehydro-3-deoxygalactonokinase [Carnimonas nigrificans]|uniref:2-dehydro-3-deoxygalactonokinase n=1 Tax=Carnimonas nigrificans TaxID=64323 RepID=UPI00047069D8|nr:2-dehydro-3-deoxygalactonokinase [Carnimonas nigrificans]